MPGGGWKALRGQCVGVRSPPARRVALGREAGRRLLGLFLFQEPGELCVAGAFKTFCDVVHNGDRSPLDLISEAVIIVPIFSPTKA